MQPRTASAYRRWLLPGLVAALILAITGGLVMAGRPAPVPPPPPGWISIRPPFVVAALAEQGETVWAGGADGVFAIDRHTGQLRPSSLSGLPPLTYVHDLKVSRDGALWIAHQGGVVRCVDQACRSFDEPGTPSSGPALSVLEDREGAIWIGTETGAVRYDGRSWRKVGVEDGLAAPAVNAMLEDRDGILWFGSASPTRGGLTRYDGSYQVYSTRDGLAHGSVNAIAQDRTGALWLATGFGSAGGASSLAGGAFTTLTKRDGLAGEKVRSVYEDRAGRLWFGSENDGLAVTDGGAWWLFTPYNGLAGWEVLRIIQDASGIYWIATENGVSRLESFDLAVAGVATAGQRKD